jgi:hypothetical protein
MRLARTSCAILLVLGCGSAPGTAAEPALDGNPTPFGPANVSFPWFAAFSPDGKWVGFADGHAPYVEGWDVAERKGAWPTDGKARAATTHRVTFSADSARVGVVQEHGLPLGRFAGSCPRPRRRPVGSLAAVPRPGRLHGPTRLPAAIGRAVRSSLRTGSG